LAAFGEERFRAAEVAYPSDRAGGWIAAGAMRTTTAEAAPHDPAERYVLFELSVEEAAATVYESLEPVRRRWRRAQG